MAITKVGLNFSNLNNLTAPNFDFKNNTVDFLNDIPYKANLITNGYLGFIVLIGLFSFLYWKLTQETFTGGDFGLSKLRGLGVASGICSIMGLLMLNLGYWTNFYHVVIFIVITFIVTLGTWKAER